MQAAATAGPGQLTVAEITPVRPAHIHACWETLAQENGRDVSTQRRPNVCTWLGLLTKESQDAAAWQLQKHRDAGWRVLRCVI